MRSIWIKKLSDYLNRLQNSRNLRHLWRLLKTIRLEKVNGNGYAFPFGIYDGDTPVGFLMIGFDTDDYWDDAPAIAKGNYNLWRLMIDKAYQGKRYGKEAVRLALEFIKTYPCGDAEYCWLSYEAENQVAAKLYSSFGFEETGDMDGEELIAVLDLREYTGLEK